MRLRKKEKDRLRYAVSSVIILGVLAIFVAIFLLKPEPIMRDPDTLCRSDEGPSSITAILLDRTDSFSAITKSDLEAQIWDRLNKIEENHEVSLFVVEPTQDKTLNPIIQVCNPGDPDNVDYFTQSEAIVRRNWQQKFRQPLEEELKSLLNEKEAPLSPIMESIQSVSITHFQNERRSVPRRLIIISDFLQNSDVISFYTNQPNFNLFKKTSEHRGLNPDLRGVEIEMWLIQRNQPQQGDGGKLLKFFQSWFSEHGGQVVRVLRTSGMND